MTELTRIENQSALETTKQHYEIMTAFVREQMQQGTDFGVIPGTKGKPTLLKPGAEKLCRLLNLRPTFELIHSIVDFDKPLFHYHYRCTLYHQQELVGQAEGNCNSFEKKYKKQEYKIFDLTNTLCKMAQKRALVAAVLCTVGASEFFTQDLDDLEDNSYPTKGKNGKNRSEKNITSKSKISNSHSPKNSPQYWQQKGQDDASKGLEPQHPNIQPYMKGYNQASSF